MLTFAAALRCRSLPGQATGQQIIEEYIKKRQAERSEQMEKLKADHIGKARETQKAAAGIQPHESDGAYQTCTPEHSQETLYNYFDTRTGRMLQNSIENQMKSRPGYKPEFDVFYSVNGLKARTRRTGNRKMSKKDSFEHMDSRLPISGLIVFTWGIPQPDQLKRYKQWLALSEEERMVYRRKAMEVGEEMAYFPLCDGFEEKAGGKQAAVEEFRKFVRKNWFEAERNVETFVMCVRNKKFCEKMTRMLQILFTSQEQTNSEKSNGGMHEVPQSGFDVFAAEKGVKPLPLGASRRTDCVQKHTKLWREWCALPKNEREAFLERISGELPCFARNNVQRDIKFNGKRKKWYRFVCNNYKKACLTIDETNRINYAKRDADVMRARENFYYTDDSRRMFWMKVKIELVRTYSLLSKEQRDSGNTC